MRSTFKFLADPAACGYLPGQVCRMEYEVVEQLAPAEYLERINRGWRRFGRFLFRPRCLRCSECRALRIPVERFRPDRSQRRCWRANADPVRIEIGAPEYASEKVVLHDAFHDYRSETRGWPLAHMVANPAQFVQTFVANPFPTLECRYYLGERLVGLGYADDLPGALSAIYFMYDPAERERGLGTFNVLSLIELARRRNVPFLHLGYYVAGSRSMVYKARFRPNQILGPDAEWREFQS